MDSKTDIRTLSDIQLKEKFEFLGYPAYRAAQVSDWLWTKGAKTFEEMTNIPKSMRREIEQQFCILPVTVDLVQISSDGTVKCAFRLWDGSCIEGVLIPTESRMTACVSSQVGCSLDCKFCATGYLKRVRNLTAAEIFDQVWILNQMAIEKYNQGLNNIVYMGMGEPLLNYKEVMQSINILTGQPGLGMSSHRITVSTAGIAKMIVKMADDNARFNLALSLHSANNDKRSAIMPINNSNNLEDLAEAMNYWYSKTGTRPTLEYAVIQGVNDGLTELEELAVFAKKFPSKINLIEYNPISQANFQSTGKSNLEKFADELQKRKLIVNIRRSRGKDIDAACGQLVNKGNA